MLRLLLFVAFLVSPFGANAGSILVLIDTPMVHITHSQYLQALSDLGFKLTYSMADDPTVKLFKYGELLYEHVLILAPTVVEFGGSAAVNDLPKYIDSGGNVLVAADSKLGYGIAVLANQCGLEFDAENAYVIDHFHYNKIGDNGRHTLLVAPPGNLDHVQPIVGSRQLAPILFRGIGMRVGKNNPLIIPLLRAPSTSFSYSPTGFVEDKPFITGNSTVLFGVMQARNNARVAFTGSIELFSNELMNTAVSSADGKHRHPTSGNKEFAVALSQWVFKEKGVLRVKSVKHHKVGEREAPAAYTIMDMLQFTIEIEERRNGKWIPYVANDVQLEFVRIDPFIRTTLKGGKDGVYTTTFQVPDVYGVFKLMVDYHRIGWTHLYNVTQVSVRPFEHTQYERFIRSAYPYYASAFSMMLSVLLFSCIFLYHKDTAPTTTTTTKKDN
uniref:Dolichyl-diphosphooligosaccharide--protein glycosyltransferase 48 kDa subunit n=1 Tax=Trichuris muris TaxID=70415 RepID=A0A5S6Q6K1_TRIMR